MKTDNCIIVINGRSVQYRYIRDEKGSALVAVDDDKTKRDGQPRVIGYVNGEVVRRTARSKVWTD